MLIDQLDTFGTRDRSRPVSSIGTIKTYSRGSAKCVFLTINRSFKRISEVTQLTVYLNADSSPDGLKKFIARPKDWKGRTSPSLGPVRSTVKGGCAHVTADVWLDKSATTGTRYGSRKVISECF
ncbi:hypothetical protein HCN51_55040 [Nonomuraea sp. FMUSA5-5]|uniref:Uncharacterized protein n=1 Tax=Nonomuraea composti TaxID=2720023 RepID=A0ABX1BN40_9ACTN|nr:hypothetical protein [Nonomuraea sp. FMUSA5-5]NJP98447.1 hypothetical protein [Nonomuraea sp. FMUSA5-5]